MDLWHLIDKTTHKKEETWTGSRAWSPDRVFPLLYQAGIVTYEFAKDDPKRFSHAIVKHGHSVTPEFIEEFLKGKDWKACEKWKFKW